MKKRQTSILVRVELTYFSPSHLASLVLAGGFSAAVFAVFRKRREDVKRRVALVFADLNLFQHLFKSAIWPPHFGNGFTLVNSAYNMCALLILAAPFVLRSHNAMLRQFFACVGTVAGAAPLLIPHWFLGQTPFTWEFLRSWTCHTLLFGSALLPVLWDLVRFDYQSALWDGFLLLGALALVFLNNAAYFACEGAPLAAALREQNPMWLLAPEEPSPLRSLLSALAFPMFGKTLPPVFWDAIPVFLASTALFYLVAMLFCGKEFTKIGETHPFFQ